MSKHIPRLSPTQKELLLDLLEVEELFRDGRLTGGTIASHAMYKMASRRGRTLPAPVAGKVQADHVFVGVFARAVNRLVSAGLLLRRSVRGDSLGLPYQWGFARHGKRDKDIFLTEEGREEALRLREKEAARQAAAAGTVRPQEGTAPPVAEAGPASASPIIQFTIKPKPPVRKPAQVVTGQFQVRFPGYTVTYVYTKRQ
ncbi:MAG: hypothetical protein FJ109_13225 [Deltaproteobacteria bacterium]|nr:hypothetical protein [Deltaproteobacteria bacterium]